MNAKEALSSPDAHRPLKRSRKEMQDESEKAEEEEGLVALVSKRQSDVVHLENRIGMLTNELTAAKKKLEAAVALLQTIQGCSSARSLTRTNGDLPESGLRHDSGHSHGRSSDKSPPIATSSARDTSHFDGSLVKSEKEKSGAGLVGREVDRSEKRADVHENHTKPRLSTSGRERKPPEVDKRDRNASGSERPQQVTETSTPPRRPEHTDLIMHIKSNAKAQPIRFSTPVYSSSQHRRKMRSLVLNPSNDSQCVTSALDGVANFWQINGKGLDINFRYTVDCLSPGQRHWPEDLTWHPDGHSLFACYTADKGDSQVSIIQNDSKQKKVQFLPSKPHVKGIVNGIAFMPWSKSLFVTGGSDHMVHLWREQEEEKTWKPKLLHANAHTSAVLGVAGVQHKQLVLSAGADKRVVGWEPINNRAVLRHDLDSKAMTVLPNTKDFNLFMVQTGQPSKQLHLFDIRSRTELHTFGWNQESSDTQSALITQSWSPDGLYVASGSADPKIVIFDIRFNGREPAQTIYAHSKRVFMALWHHTLPMMLSISSDLNIGVHRLHWR